MEMHQASELKVLLVDDERNIRQTLQVSLRKMGCQVALASSVDEAVNLLKRDSFEFVLTDFRLEAQTGIDVIRAAKYVQSNPVTVVMTAYASFENAVTAIKEGAFDYLPKPFSNSQLAHLVQKVRTIVELRRENERLKRRTHLHDYFEGMTSPAMVRLQEFVDKVAPTDSTVLMSGESGTGKYELARMIHQRSNRSTQAFIVMNCTSSDDTFEISKARIQNHGTLFIDEIGDLTDTGQAKLLRLLDEKVIEDSIQQPIPSFDLRILAATNRNLEEEVRAGRFREDLYYRLNVFECAVVPLRHRREDTPVLIERFYRTFLKRAEESTQRLIPEDVYRRLISYPWPGNVRELRNVIERLVFLAKGRAMRLEDLPESILSYPRHALSKGSEQTLQTLEELEKEHIQRVLLNAKSQEQAAAQLGITTVTLWRKRKQYGLP